MKKIYIIGILLFLTIHSVSAIHINEFLFNPIGIDDGKEFVEIEGTNNLSNYLIGDLSKNDSLTMLQITDSNYSLIVPAAFNYSGLNCSIYSSGSRIGNNLNNDVDSIFLYDNSSNLMLIDNVSYTGTSIAEGLSLALVNNTWTAQVPTPCLPNSVADNTSNATIPINQSLNDTNATDDSSINITNPTNQTNMSNQTNSTNSFNETNTTNSSNQTFVPSCSISIGITTNKEVYNNKEQIQFYNTLNATNYDFQIQYWIEDLFGNIIKEKINTTNTNKKTYTPDIDETDKVYIVKNSLQFINCSNTGTNSSQKQIIILNPSFNPTQNCPACPVCSTVKSSSSGGQCPEKTCSCPKTSASSTLSITPSQIDSFYTRSKKTNENITLYTSVEGNGTYALSLFKLIPIQSYSIEIAGKVQQSFKTFAENEKTIYLLTLEQNASVLDSKRLEYGQADPNQTLEAVSEEAIISVPEASFSSKSAIPTAEVVYQSPLAKVKNYLNYGLVMVIILGIALYLGSKYYGKIKQNKYQRENRTGLGKGTNTIRDGRLSQGTRSQDPQRLHSSTKEE